MPKLSGIHYKALVCIFQKAGFVYSRTKGDHLVYKKPGAIRPLIIPMYEEVPVFIIKALLHTAKMERSQYFSLLEECK